MSRGHRAVARVAAEVVGGRTRCTTLRSDPPLTFREVPGGVRWVGTAAGPVGGDDLRLDVALGPGASLSLSSVAASLVHPGPAGEASSTRVDVSLAAGTSLRWWPEPTVVLRGAEHHARTKVVLDADADVVLVETLVLGRHAEASGRIRSTLRVERPSGPVLCTTVDVGVPGWDGPAGTGGDRVLAQVLLAGEPARCWGQGGADGRVVAHGGVRWADSALVDGSVLVTVLAPGAIAAERTVRSVVAQVGAC